MRITGTLDVRDQIAWINWRMDKPARGRARWWHRLFLPIALVLPPVLFQLVGDPFHWKTYVGSIVCWTLLFALWRCIQLLYARGRTRRKQQSIPFELERLDGAIRLRASGRTHEYPADKVSIIRLKQNLVLTMDGFPICITPRNENIDGEYTIDDIERIIKPAEPAHAADPPSHEATDDR